MDAVAVGRRRVENTICSFFAALVLESSIALSTHLWQSGLEFNIDSHRTVSYHFTRNAFKLRVIIRVLG